MISITRPSFQVLTSLIGVVADAIVNSETSSRGLVRADDSQCSLLIGR